MVETSEEIVLARVVGTSPGRTAFSDDPADSVTFENVEFTVERAFKGDLRKGSSFVLERVAGSAFDADGGPFAAGNVNVLFLRKQLGSPLYLQLNDQARFLVDGSDRLVTDNGHDPVSASLHGMGVQQLADFVASSKRPR